jgi:hypothetical protein
MRKLLLAAGLLGPAVFVGGFMVLGARRPDYLPRYTFASQLGLDGGGWVWRTVNLVAGLLIVAFGFGAHRTVKVGVGSSWGGPALAAAGLGFATFAISWDDSWLLYPPPKAPRGIGSPRSPHGWGHQVGAFIAFLGLEGAHLIFARRFAGHGDGWHHAYSVGTAIAFPLLYLAAIGSGIASSIPGHPLGGNAGLLQKASLATSLAWVAWLASHLWSAPAADGAG